MASNSPDLPRLSVYRRSARVARVLLDQRRDGVEGGLSSCRNVGLTLAEQLRHRRSPAAADPRGARAAYRPPRLPTPREPAPRRAPCWLSTAPPARRAGFASSAALSAFFLATSALACAPEKLLCLSSDWALVSMSPAAVYSALAYLMALTVSAVASDSWAAAIFCSVTICCDSRVVRPAPLPGRSTSAATGAACPPRRSCASAYFCSSASFSCSLARSLASPL